MKVTQNVFVPLLLLFFFFFSVTSAHPNSIELSSKFPQAAISLEFLKIYNQLATSPLNTSKESHKFASYKIIFVRGIFTNAYGSLSRTLFNLGTPIPHDLVQSFQTQLEWFNYLGVDSVIIPSNTEMSSSYNGEEIAAMVKESDKKVILISHSKGGLDVLFALVHHPEILPKIAGWLNLQAPNLGSPVVDCLVKCPSVGTATMLGLISLQGEYAALEEITTDKILKFRQDYQSEIKELLKKVPTISLAGEFERPPLTPVSFLMRPISNRSFLEPFNLFIQMTLGESSDGFTPTNSSCLPDTPCITLANFDHAGPVMDLAPFYSYSKSQRINLTRALLYLLLK